MIRDVVKTVFKTLSQPERIEFIITALQLEGYKDTSWAIKKCNSGDLFHLSSTKIREDYDCEERFYDSD